MKTEFVPDGKSRCTWCGTEEVYVNYHDDEWGVPVYDSRALFEKLILDGFQAGLSWLTILRKRDAFIEAFDGFEPEIIAKYAETDIERLLGNAGIIRHRGKIAATIGTAQAYLEINKRKGGFSKFLWDYVGGTPVQNSARTMGEVLTQDELSTQTSKDLKNLGFKFCGPTIVYAFMEAVGMINDHLTTCYRHDDVKKLVKK
jgi:DNA-3-methyladenine glycosylase I